MGPEKLPTTDQTNRKTTAETGRRARNEGETKTFTEENEGHEEELLILHFRCLRIVKQFHARAF